MADDLCSGRSIIDEFLTLPDAVGIVLERRLSDDTDDYMQKQVPGYYDQIKLPLAVDTIEVSIPALVSALPQCRLLRLLSLLWS